MRRQAIAAVASTAAFLVMAAPAAAHLETPAGDFGGMGKDTLPSGKMIEDIGDPSAPTEVGRGLALAETKSSQIDCVAGAKFPETQRFCSVLDGGPPDAEPGEELDG